VLARLCVNWKVLALLALLGGVLWFLAPELLPAALPLLALAACPLAMVLGLLGFRATWGQSGCGCAKGTSASSDG